MSATSRSSAAPTDSLIGAVQHNCDLADARHARELSLCTYLLEMRELFRWERDLPLGVVPERSDVGRWIAARESLWDTLEGDDDYLPVPIDQGIAPFEDAAVNRRLDGFGMVYGAGIGRFGRPEFFLAEQLATEQRGGARIVIAGRELARGMSPPPALSRGDTVIIRSDAVRRWLWTRIEVAHRRRSADDPMNAALATLAADAVGAADAAGTADAADAADAVGAAGEPHAALERLLPQVLETMILHELGEIEAGRRLGPDWQRMLVGVADRRSEFAARAVRDLLADCLSTLPALIARDARSAIHFWFATLEGLRRQLDTGLRPAYRAWRGGDRAALVRAIETGRSVWEARAQDLLGAWRTGGGAAVSALAESWLDAAGTQPPNA